MSSRVVLVAPVHPLRGGIAHHSACLARALDARVISFEQLYPRALFPGTSERDTVSARPITAPDAEPLLIPWDPRTWRRALARIDALAPDLVVVAWWHSSLLPVTAGLLGALRARGRRTLLLCHNTASHDRAAFDAVTWPLLSRLPSAFLVHGSHQAAALRARLGSSARVLCSPHPAYDVFAEVSHATDDSATAARARLGLRADDEVVLQFGLVRPYKGAARGVTAMAQLAARRPRALLLLAGEHYGRPPTIPPGARVVLHDRFVANEAVADLFRAADVLLAPYAPGDSHSGAVQIARAFGLPVVGTDGVGLRELVPPDCGVLAPPDGLADALERVLADAELRARLAAGMRASAADAAYSWRALADAVLSACA